MTPILISYLGSKVLIHLIEPDNRFGGGVILSHVIVVTNDDKLYESRFEYYILLAVPVSVMIFITFYSKYWTKKKITLPNINCEIKLKSQNNSNSCVKQGG